MTAPTRVPFVAQVRTRRETLRVGTSGAGALLLRVEVPERWDVLRVEASPSEPVLSVKTAVLERMLPGAQPDDWVMKLRGIEVLDERQSLSTAGAINGSIFLLTHRRRRPVR